MIISKRNQFLLINLDACFLSKLAHDCMLACLTRNHMTSSILPLARCITLLATSFCQKNLLFAVDNPYANTVQTIPLRNCLSCLNCFSCFSTLLIIEIPFFLFCLHVFFLSLYSLYKKQLTRAYHVQNRAVVSFPILDLSQSTSCCRFCQYVV